MSVTLHRFSHNYQPGDLKTSDLTDIWNILEAEKLVDIFFHDGSVGTLRDFIFYATRQDVWFYAVKHKGEWVGFGSVTERSPTGRTGFAHICSFRAGRGDVIRQASLNWLDLMRQAGLYDLMAVVPASYRGVKLLIKDLGFKEVISLKKSIKIRRGQIFKDMDACVFHKKLKIGV